jgi:hypothetical protein
MRKQVLLVVVVVVVLVLKKGSGPGRNHTLIRIRGTQNVTDHFDPEHCL